MGNETAYNLLRVALGRESVSQDVALLLRSTVQRAIGELERAGLPLNPACSADAAFIAAYAEWIYRRRNAEDPKPRSLTDEIRSRQLARSTGEAAP